MGLFYQSDEVVRRDPELQAWCREITDVGLCQAQDRGRCQTGDGHSSGGDGGMRAGKNFTKALPCPLMAGTPPCHHTLLLT